MNSSMSFFSLILESESSRRRESIDSFSLGDELDIEPVLVLVLFFLSADGRRRACSLAVRVPGLDCGCLDDKRKEGPSSLLQAWSMKSISMLILGNDMFDLELECSVV